METKSISINVVKNQKLAARNGFITMRVQAIRIGDAVLVSMPVEPFAEIASSIKAKSSFDNLIVSGFSNGHNAYLPTTEAYEEGGYEVDEAYKVYPSVQMIAPTSEALIRRQVNELALGLRRGVTQR